MTDRTRSTGWGLLAALAISLPAAAQDDSDVVQRLERQLRELDSTYRLAVPSDQPISERLFFDYGGSLRFAFVAIDSPTGNTRVLRQSDAIVYVRAELDGAHRVYGRLRFLYNDFNTGDSFDGRGDELEAPIGDRYWYEFNLRNQRLAETGQPGEGNVFFRGGRQYVQWGSGLALSNVLYPAVLDVEVGQVGITGLAGLTPHTGTVDFDGSRPEFDSNVDRAFYGGRLEYRGHPTHRPYVSVLVQRDGNNDGTVGIPTPVGPIATMFDYDSEYWAVGSRGSFNPQLLYHAEVVHESGETLSSPFDPVTGVIRPQRHDDISAWAGIFGLTYLPRDEGNSRIEFELIVGSGDGDRLDTSDTFGGNRRGTTDGAFNGLGYVNTGLALAPEVANLCSFRVGASTTLPFVPDEALRASVNGFLFTKLDSGDAMNFPTTTDTLIGCEVDLGLDWRIHSDVSASLRYGVFFPGDAIPTVNDTIRHFLYAGVTYAF